MTKPDQYAGEAGRGLLCLIGWHRWHPTALSTDRRLGISKLICTRCGKRKWWRL